MKLILLVVNKNLSLIKNKDAITGIRDNKTGCRAGTLHGTFT
jgi:hypothetical protein